MAYASLKTFQFDKESDSFGQSGSDPRNDFLDQYLTFDTVDLDSSTFLNAPQSTLSVKASGSESTGASFTAWEEEARHSSAYRPQGEPADINSALYRDNSKGNHFHSIESCRASNSEFDLLSLESISLQSPHLDISPPSSPQPFAAETVRGRRRFIERITKPFRKEPNIPGQSNSSPIRKATSPPKMMRASQYSGRRSVPDWERYTLDASKFQFGFQNGSRPISPPPCPRIPENSEMNHNIISPAQGHGSFAWDHPLPQSYSCRPQSSIISLLATPPGDVTTFQQANTLQAPANNMVYTSSHRHHASASWAQTPVSSEFSFDTSAEYTVGGESNPLWYGNTTAVNLAQPCPSNYSRSCSRHNNTNLAMQLQAELAYSADELALGQSNIPSGLMIQNMPGTPGQQSFAVDSSQIGQEQGNIAPVGSTASRHCSQPQPHHHYTQSQPQPILSEYPSPKNKRDKSHTRTDLSPSPSPKSRSPSFHVSKKRSRSFSRKRTTNDTPKTPKTPAVDFVNFTPHDSMKILTGVAPSGSSKTKARREKEAMEKTRRLSQAAVRAVQAAGGSIESLVEQGLI